MQLLMNVFFFSILMIKLFKDKILFFIDKFVYNLLIKQILHLIQVQTSCPALFLPEKYKNNGTTSTNSCLETFIILTFKKIDIILIFQLGKYVKSQFLSTRYNSQLISRQTINLRSKHEGKYLKAKIIEAIIYDQPLNIKSDFKDCYIALCNNKII